MKILKFSKDKFIEDQGEYIYDTLGRGWVEACDGQLASYNDERDCLDVTGDDGNLYSVESYWCEEVEVDEV